jgi:AcrR family transcriptional regulator
MKRTIVPNAAPKLRLIEAAEKLFAEHGFDVVSVRDITQAAGGNVAAVNYHFGSRDGLVAVVMNRYMTPVHEQRLARLDTAEQKWAGQAVPVEEVVDAFVRPLVTRVEKSELSEQLFYCLVGRIFGSHGNGMPDEIKTRLSVSSARFTRAFGKALPAVSEADLVWRLHFVVGGMIHMLTHGESLLRLSAGAGGSPGMDSTLDRFLRFAVAGLRDGVMSPLLPHAVAAAEVPDDGQRPLPPAAGEVPDDGQRPPPQAAGEVPDDGQRPPPQAAGEVPDDGQRPPPQAAGEPAPKAERKRASKVVADSPQVMFEF